MNNGMISDRPIRIALLSGAIKNSGDYLIVMRSKELLKFCYPNCEITEFPRVYALDDRLQEINCNDIAVFAGGPGYLPNCYPDHMPLVRQLEDIKIPMFSLGMGWYGPDSRISTVYQYLFTEQTKRLFKRIESDTTFLGCRDWFAVNVLRNNGIEGGVMTGCPAWYHLPTLEAMKRLKNPMESLNKICISDPANPRDLEEAILVADYLTNTFPNVQIQFIFHRGIPELTKEEKLYGSQEMTRLLLQALEVKGIQYLDISNSEKGFSVYDDCDLHIGFRVHAHIYNLSRRNASLLIEEDGRGAGVNDALGLRSIPAYEFIPGSREDSALRKTANRHLIQQTDDMLNRLWNTNFTMYEQAFDMMNRTFDTMIEHIGTIDRILSE